MEPDYNLLEAAQLRVLQARATLKAIGSGQRQQREQHQQQQQDPQPTHPVPQSIKLPSPNLARFPVTSPQGSINWATGVFEDKVDEIPRATAQAASRCEEEEPNVLHVKAEHQHEGISNSEKAAKDREGSEGAGRREDEEAGAHAIGRSSGGERDGRGRRQGPAVPAELPQKSNGPEEQATAQDLFGTEGSWRERMQSRMHTLQAHVESRAQDGQEEDLKGKMAQIQQLRRELEASSSVSSSIGYDAKWGGGYDSGDSTSHHSKHLANFSSKRRTFSDSPPQHLQAPRNRPPCTPEKNDDNSRKSSQGEAGRFNFCKRVQ